MSDAAALQAALTRGAETREGRRAVARALNLLESSAPADVALARALVDAAALDARAGAQVVGLTGPPGVGKSTLAGALVRAWRAAGLTVAVLAVDPSSRRTGGALLGDRARMDRDPDDSGVFIRSMAAGEQLGGLAPATFDAAVVLRAAFDRVLVETVGVGQSETDVASVADATAVVVQPGSGDVLQFLKAGLMEVFDVLVVNKADMTEAARRARIDLKQALRALGSDATAIVSTSALDGGGVERLVVALDGVVAERGAILTARRREQLREQVVRVATRWYGTAHLAMVGGRSGALARIEGLGPGARPSAMMESLRPAWMDGQDEG